MKEEFIKFLKSKRLWSKFKREFKDGNLHPKYYKSINEYIDDDNFKAEGLIVDICRRPKHESLGFWQEIHFQWVEHLKELKTGINS